MLAKGTFEITMHADPPFDTEGGITLGRVCFDKQFSGPLTATSKVTMLAARTPIANSAGYVALERITGALEGRKGSFCVLQMGTMDRGTQALTITVVPDSGTGDLVGLRGKMEIEVVDGQHWYKLDYALS